MESKAKERKGRITYVSVDPEKWRAGSPGVTQLSGDQLCRFVSRWESPRLHPAVT